MVFCCPKILFQKYSCSTKFTCRFPIPVLQQYAHIHMMRRRFPQTNWQNLEWENCILGLRDGRRILNFYNKKLSSQLDEHFKHHDPIIKCNMSVRRSGIPDPSMDFNLLGSAIDDADPSDSHPDQTHDGSSDSMRSLLENQNLNFANLIKAVIENVRPVSLPIFNPLAQGADARAWCSTLDVCMRERPLHGSQLIMALSYALRAQNMVKSATYDKTRFDKNKAQVKLLSVGDLVLLQNEPRNQMKLDPKFKVQFQNPQKSEEHRRNTQFSLEVGKCRTPFWNGLRIDLSVLQLLVVVSKNVLCTPNNNMLLDRDKVQKAKTKFNFEKTTSMAEEDRWSVRLTVPQIFIDTTMMLRCDQFTATVTATVDETLCLFLTKTLRESPKERQFLTKRLLCPLHDRVTLDFISDLLCELGVARDITCLYLGRNNFNELDDLKSLISKLPSLQAIHLEYNRIDSMERLYSIKNRSIQHLNLHGNPFLVSDNHPTYFRYVRDLRVYFPFLKTLDGAPTSETMPENLMRTRTSMDLPSLSSTDTSGSALSSDASTTSSSSSSASHEFIDDMERKLWEDEVEYLLGLRLFVVLNGKASLSPSWAPFGVVYGYCQVLQLTAFLTDYGTNKIKTNLGTPGSAYEVRNDTIVV
ncbi:unnamed protein product [Nesidiocoris tenuis]|uniref:NXF1/2/3/5-like leucine-rich repeat domain-containing protein n=1 Tax=Nesidiocoris tenuis TaxID=355587 RepID=A0A6H5GKG9_9HEMI|nr:unnamed protein product [Nesidiocoris tenuis]